MPGPVRPRAGVRGQPRVGPGPLSTELGISGARAVGERVGPRWCRLIRAGGGAGAGHFAPCGPGLSISCRPASSPRPSRRSGHPLRTMDACRDRWMGISFRQRHHPPRRKGTCLPTAPRSASPYGAVSPGGATVRLAYGGVSSDGATVRLAAMRLPRTGHDGASRGIASFGTGAGRVREWVSSKVSLGPGQAVRRDSPKAHKARHRAPSRPVTPRLEPSGHLAPELSGRRRPAREPTCPFRSRPPPVVRRPIRTAPAARPPSRRRAGVPRR